MHTLTVGCEPTQIDEDGARLMFYCPACEIASVEPAVLEVDYPDDLTCANCRDEEIEAGVWCPIVAAEQPFVDPAKKARQKGYRP